MSRSNDHPQNELHLLLDGQLGGEARARVEAHVAACPQCARELEALRWAKRAVRETPPANGPEAPPEVVARVFAALDQEDQENARREAGATKPARTGLRRWRLLPMAFAIVAAAAVVFFMGRPQPFDPVTDAERDLAGFVSGTLALDLQTESPPELESYFASGGIAFATRVFDFGMMDFTLRGGRVHDLDGRPSALFAYASTQGGHIVCQMYEGGLDELPAGHERRVLDGIDFRVYRRGAYTFVFWQEGPLVCVLASDGDPEQAIQFARAKAKAAEL